MCYTGRKQSCEVVLLETRKRYYEDPHCSRFTARVLSCRPGEGGYRVVLDATAFYPEGGGQAADTGTLGGAAVLHVSHQGEEVIHLCDAPLTVGSEVEGILDYEKRFLRMQQHTGEHMVSGILHRRFGCHNTGFHMGQDVITIDFDTPIPPEALPEIEAEANAALWQNLPVRCWYPEPEELRGLSYRTKRPLPWPVRMVEIPGVDRCACCGTHVTATGEVGLIKLLSAVGFRGGTRMEMACGAQALGILNTAWLQNKQVSQAFSVQPEQTGQAARHMNALLAGKDGRILELQRRIFAGIAEGYAGSEPALHFEPALTAPGLQELADAMARQCPAAAVFSPGDDGSFGFCLVSREEDLRPLGKALTQGLSGRGGGRAAIQQGRVRAGRQEIEDFFRERGWNV